ncbi:FAD binding domain-containing protein [Streptomyces sp. NPDC048720]|uniref:FAD binding domain-containing protein n=1 Tax=Streptomyces sp. NPDC048720 TaxID=3365588 RepID=UPI003713D3F6
MLLRLPTSVSEAQECLAEGAVPVGGATLVWAAWQRDGFPASAMSLRELPEANVIGREELGAAVVLAGLDDRVPDVLRRAAATVGTGAVRRTATVGGNLAGSALRCLLPPALVLDARARVLDPAGVRETGLAEAAAGRAVLLGVHWREPVAAAYRKLPGVDGGAPPLVVASALHAGERGPRLRVAVRTGYDVLSEAVDRGNGAGDALAALRETPLGSLPPVAWKAVREQVSGLLDRPEGR